MATFTDLKAVANFTTQAEGTITENQSGPFPGLSSVKFVGTGARADAGAVYPFTGTANFSIEFWFKLDAFTTGNVRLISTEFNNGSDQGWWMTFVGATGVADIVRTVGGVSVFNGLGTFVVGKWHHVVGTYDGANLRGYLDGVLAAGPTASSASIVAGTTTLRIGAFGATSPSVNGWMAGLAIYGDDLTAAEVLARWRAGKQRARRRTA